MSTQVKTTKSRKMPIRSFNVTYRDASGTKLIKEKVKAKTTKSAFTHIWNRCEKENIILFLFSEGR